MVNSLEFKKMKQISRRMEQLRVNIIESGHIKDNLEEELEQLVLKNQNLPEQKNCHHGIYSRIGRTNNICSFCFWEDKNPCAY